VAEVAKMRDAGAREPIVVFGLVGFEIGAVCEEGVVIESWVRQAGWGSAGREVVEDSYLREFPLFGRGR
jgi:hypothetical protein